MPIKVALPKGRLADQTSVLLQRGSWELEGYHKAARLYHLKSEKFPALSFKVFQEKDIPIQVAIGNYDLGICGLDWIEELVVKYQNSAVVRVKDLEYGRGALYIAVSPSGQVSSLAQLKDNSGMVRIVSEYPNLAESFALKSRLGRFSVFPVWGGAEVYPPENADLALVSARTEEELGACGLVAMSKVLDFSAFVIANRNSWETKDLGGAVAALCDHCGELVGGEKTIAAPFMAPGPVSAATDSSIVRLALPDGHQQTPAVELLRKAGIEVDDYPSATGNRRPGIHLDGVTVKVIRPQDMPLQVANGNFDLAITGKDWLSDHLYQFPSSPVKELLDLKFGWVKLVAVVSRALTVADVSGLRQLKARQPAPLRVASEYVNIADKYARDNHLGHYRVVPTWGATEAFLPDDADLLIENTQTGQTIAKHNLKIIDTLFESTARLIGNTGIKPDSSKGRILKLITDRLRAAVEANT